MTPIEKARAALKQEQSRREEFYEGAEYALKLVEAAQVGNDEKPKTNGDLVRAMSDEELINFYFGGCNEVCINDGTSCTDAMCREGMRAWLRQEVER